MLRILLGALSSLWLLLTTACAGPMRPEAAPVPVLTAPAAEPAPAPCALTPADVTWVRGLLAAWEGLARGSLRVEPGPLPWLVFVGSACAWHVNPEPATFAMLHGEVGTSAEAVAFDHDTVPIRGVRHSGAARLPDGSEVPAVLVSFAAAYGEDQRRPYVVMATPAVWRAEPRHRDDETLDTLIRSVFVHEMTHTLQVRTLGARLDEVSEGAELGDEIDDDVVQRRFGSDPGFRAAFEAERELLFRAAAEKDPARQRALVWQALRGMEGRRSRWLSGGDAIFAELEDLFLVMEGVANWAAYRTALADGLGAAEALAMVRRGGRFWSQDLGLAVFLAVDALVEDWQPRVLGDTPPTVLQLLREAAEGRR